jgi:hypothetical protein
MGACISRTNVFSGERFSRFDVTTSALWSPAVASAVPGMNKPEGDRSKLDVTFDHRGLFLVAVVEGDSAEMERQANLAKGKPDEFDMLQAQAEVAACAASTT